MLLSSCGNIRAQVFTVKTWMTKLLYKLKSVSASVMSIIAGTETWQNVQEAVEGALADTTYTANVIVDNVTQKVNVSYRELLPKLQEAVQNNSNTLTYTIPTGEAAGRPTTIEVEDLLQDLQNKIDVQTLQVNAITASLATGAHEAITVIKSTLENVSAVNFSAIAGFVDDLTSVVSGTTPVGGVMASLFAYTLSAFGLSKDVPDNEEASYWAGITGTSVWSNLGNFVEGAGSALLHVVYNTLRIIVTAILKILYWLFSAIEGIIKWIGTKFADWNWNITTGTAVQAEGGYYGFSSKYSRKSTIGLGRYPLYYLAVHGYFGTTGYSVLLGNVRITLIPNIPDFNASTTWQQWMNLDQSRNYITCEIEVSPIYGPALLAALENFRVNKGYYGSNFLPQIFDDSEQNFRAFDFTPKNLNKYDLAAIVNALAIVGQTDYRVPSKCKPGAVARWFYLGYHFANIILSCPFDRLDFNPNVKITTAAINNDTKLKRWFNYVLVQLYWWSVTDASGATMDWNWLAKEDNISWSGEYWLFPDWNTTDWHHWATGFMNIIPSNDYIQPSDWKFPEMLDDFATYYQEHPERCLALPQFGSNLWYAYILSACKSSIDSSGKYVVTFKDCNMSEMYRYIDFYMFGPIPYGSLPYNKLTCNPMVGSSGSYDDSVIGTYFDMVMRAWNNYNYAGNFAPFSFDESLNYDEYHILTDDEMNKQLQAYGSKTVIAVIAVIVIIVIAKYAVKAVKAYRLASAAAETAAFNYGQAVLDGDTATANALYKQYKTNRLKAKLLGILSPAKVSAAIAAGSSTASVQADSGALLLLSRKLIGS